MKLNVLKGMKHFTQMIMMMNLTIHTTVVPFQTAVPHPTKFLTKFHRVICKRKKKRKISTKRKEMKMKDKNNVIKEKNETSKERTGNLYTHKNRYYHQSKAPAERIQSTFSSAITKKRKKIVLFSDNILKNLRMGEFNSFIKKRSFLESVSRGKSKTIKSLHHPSP